MSARDEAARATVPDFELRPDLDEPEDRESGRITNGHAPLFESRESEELRSRWESVQGSFVDAPRKSVEQADGLVKDVLGRLETRFSQERERLERDWSAGGEATTEDLRMALRSYRSFFERLLTI